jgi:class 3 adenylate cyclase
VTDNQPLAIGFSDLREFSSYTAERGDEEALRIARDFTSLVEESLKEHGGRMLKTYGDGVMTSFDAAERAVLCAAGMQKALSIYNQSRSGEPICAGIGLTWGSAIRTGDDLFGHSVNLAKRLADVAKGWQIIVSPSIVEQSRESVGFRFRDLGDREIKGLGTHRLYELVWRDEVAKLCLPDNSLDFVLTGDQKLVLEFAKPVGEALTQIQQKLLPKDGEKGAAAYLKRRLTARFQRELPKWIDAVRRYGGMGLEHRLDDIEASVTGGKLRIRLPDGKDLTFDEHQINLEEAERFLGRLAALRQQKGRPAQGR